MIHPCDETPIISEHLGKIYSSPTNEDLEAFSEYLRLCRQLLISNTGNIQFFVSYKISF